jgi:hypothetical protein
MPGIYPRHKVSKINVGFSPEVCFSRFSLEIWPFSAAWQSRMKRMQMDRASRTFEAIEIID